MDILREAGFPVYFVLALGAWSLVQAWRFRLGKIDGVALAGPLIATMIVGALATAWGVQLSFGGVPRLPDPSQQHWVAYLGIKEALYNFDLACALSAAAVLLGTTARRTSPVTASSRAPA